MESPSASARSRSRASTFGSIVILMVRPCLYLLLILLLLPRPEQHRRLALGRGLLGSCLLALLLVVRSLLPSNRSHLRVQGGFLFCVARFNLAAALAQILQR